MNSAFIKVDGVKIHYYDSKTNNKPLIFLVHGLHGTADNVIPIGEYLSSLFRVIIPDLPGFGRSQELSLGFTISETAAIFLMFLDKLNLKKYYLGGFSLGSTITIEMIKKNPSSCQGIVVSQPFISLSCTRLKKNIIRILRPLVYIGKKKFLSEMVIKLILENPAIMSFLISKNSPRKFDPQELKIRINNVKSCTAKTYVYTLDEILHYKVSASATRISNKALFILNPEDEMLNYEKTYDFCKMLFPHHKLIKVKIDNHNPITVPTVDEISRQYPTLLTEIKSGFGI